jgi:hypothetical protein
MTIEPQTGETNMERPKNVKPKLNAEAAYENAHLVAQDLVARIGELLFDMPAPGNDAHPIHWGHVGDINHVNTMLLEVVTFLDRTGK